MYTASEILVQGSVAAGFEKVWQIISIYIRRLHNPCFQCSSFIFILCRKHFQTSRCKTRISWSIGEKCFPSPVPAWRGCTWHLKCFFPELQRIVLFFNTVTWGYNFRRKANGFLYILWFCPPFNQYHQFPVNLDLSKLSSDFCSTLHFRPWKAGVKKIKKKIRKLCLHGRDHCQVVNPPVSRDDPSFSGDSLQLWPNIFQYISIFFTKSWFGLVCHQLDQKKNH